MRAALLISLVYSASRLCCTLHDGIPLSQRIYNLQNASYKMVSCTYIPMAIDAQSQVTVASASPLYSGHGVVMPAMTALAAAKLKCLASLQSSTCSVTGEGGVEDRER